MSIILTIRLVFIYELNVHIGIYFFTFTKNKTIKNNKKKQINSLRFIEVPANIYLYL